MNSAMCYSWDCGPTGTGSVNVPTLQSRLGAPVTIIFVVQSKRGRNLRLILKCNKLFVISGLDSRAHFPFGRICFVVLVMRKGGESS